MNHNLLMQDDNWGLLLFSSSLFLKQINKQICIKHLICELKESVRVSGWIILHIISDWKYESLLRFSSFKRSMIMFKEIHLIHDSVIMFKEINLLHDSTHCWKTNYHLHVVKFRFLKTVIKTKIIVVYFTRKYNSSIST